jgi:hypothetical protein
MTKKFKSRRWWIVIWAIAYVSIISFVCIKSGYDAAWIAGTMAVVAGIPVTYVTFTTIKKKDGE